jgi:hypothetical protein
MHESFKRIIAEGIRDLESKEEHIRMTSEGAAERVAQAKRDMAALSNFAEDLPQKVLERFSRVLTAEFTFGERSEMGWGMLEFGGNRQTLQGLWGGPEKPMSGRNRAVVILEKVD